MHERYPSHTVPDLDDDPVPDDAHDAESEDERRPRAIEDAPLPTEKTPLLGWVALGIGGMSLIGSVLSSLVVGAILSPPASGESAERAGAAIATGFVLATGLAIWFGLGLWAILQGCVAIKRKRGVRPGIGAIALGLVGPWFGVVAAIAVVVMALSPG